METKNTDFIKVNNQRIRRDYIVRYELRDITYNMSSPYYGLRIYYNANGVVYSEDILVDGGAENATVENAEKLLQEWDEIMGVNRIMKLRR